MPNNDKLPEGINYTFETKRLIIRPLEEQDREFYISLYTDKKIMRHICEPFSLEAANKAFDFSIKAMSNSLKTLKPSYLIWTICDKESLTTNGILALNWSKKSISVKQNSESSYLPEIGIMLKQKSSGKLIPKESFTGLLNFCFIQLELPQVNAFFNPNNIPVKRFITALGFQELSIPKAEDGFMYVTPSTLIPYY